jgi:hypothetical protein
MGEGRNGMRRGVFAAWAGAILATALLQSAVHLAVVLDAGHVGTVVDLDRSNGLPDIVSTAALAAAAAGAFLIARDKRGERLIVPTMLAAVLTLLTLADIVHDGPHPASGTGWLVIVTVAATGLLLALIATTSGVRPRVTLAVAGCLLVGSFLVNGLDQWDPQRFERERGDPVTEYQIVAKEGLELLGWSLVAIALWDEALRRRRPRALSTRRASRGRVASRRRAV